MLVLAVVLAAALGWAWMQRSLPQLDGTAAGKGLGASAQIVRDPEGVPHIFAQSERDGWYALGYTHAQDRLWQMEFQRRVCDGRLSEFLGERAFEVDRLMRTLGIARLSERIVANMDASNSQHQVGLVKTKYAACFPVAFAAFPYVKYCYFPGSYLYCLERKLKDAGRKSF